MYETLNYRLGGQWPLTIRARCGRNRYCPDPLGNVTADAKDADCHTSDIGHWFAMTVVFDAFRTQISAFGFENMSLRGAEGDVAIRFPGIRQNANARRAFTQYTAKR